MTKLSVALLQLETPGNDPEVSWQRGELAVRHAAARGADIVLFPEMWQIGYAPCPDDEPGRLEWLGAATPRDGEYLRRFSDLARELKVAIVVTYLERFEVGARNAATLIDSTGTQVLHYAKVHTCDFGMEASLVPGDRLDVVELQTRQGPVSVGLMICYDREFPETARVLMLRGAELVLVPNSCYLSDDRIAQLRSRAFENMTAYALVNYPEPARSDNTAVDYAECNGRSAAYTGMCFDDEGVPLDQEVVLAGQNPCVEFAVFDIDALRKYRAEETWGDAFRKPNAYASISDPGPTIDVFKRSESRRTANFVEFTR